MASIQTWQSGAIAEIRLDRPPGNRIDFAMREELRHAITQIGNSGARVLLISGNGPDFCRGGDVREWLDVPSTQLRPKIEVFAHALAALRQLPIVTIAAVRGACRGGGFELALSCDFIVADRSAEFAFPEARSGILTLQGGILMLAERIGARKALELVLLGNSLAAGQLLEWNVVNRIVDGVDLDREAHGLAEQFAHVPPPVVAQTKALLRIQRDNGHHQAMARLYDLSMPLFDQEDTQSLLRSSAASISASQKQDQPPKEDHQS
jgi:enoyl-CoA hydratase/carnithine racemase